jgi:hypothetical protein
MGTKNTDQKTFETCKRFQEKSFCRKVEEISGFSTFITGVKVIGLFSTFSTVFKSTLN